MRIERGDEWVGDRRPRLYGTGEGKFQEREQKDARVRRVEAALKQRGRELVVVKRGRCGG